MAQRSAATATTHCVESAIFFIEPTLPTRNFQARLARQILGYPLVAAGHIRLPYPNLHPTYRNFLQIPSRQVSALANKSIDELRSLTVTPSAGFRTYRPGRRVLPRLRQSGRARRMR